MLHNKANQAGLPADSQGWLTAALDPYHDYQYEVNGLPDEMTAPSVVQIHNQSFTLTVPASAGVGNWDATVLYTGFDSQIGASAANGGLISTTSSAYHPYDHGAISAGVPFGALTWWAGAAGVDAKLMASVVAGDTNGAFGSIQSTDRGRVVACGFEVHNTTAEIYKQGSMVAAMLADPCCDAGVVRYTDTNAAAWTNVDMQSDRSPVYAVNSATLLSVPGAQTWPAEKGAYAIPRMTKVPRWVNFLNAGSLNRTPVIYESGGRTGSSEPWATSTSTGLKMNALFPSGFSPIQLYFSGLSNQTSLTITFRTVVEYFPALGSALLPLAEPSPVFDPVALEIYSRAIREAPYCVTVDQNAAGDYFRKVLRIIAKGLDVAGPFFGHYAPVAALGSKAASALASIGEGKKRIPKEAAAPQGRSRRQ